MLDDLGSFAILLAVLAMLGAALAFLSWRRERGAPRGEHPSRAGLWLGVASIAGIAALVLLTGWGAQAAGSGLRWLSARGVPPWVVIPCALVLVWLVQLPRALRLRAARRATR